MKAMVLAAGEGSRLGALTEDKPKPMLAVGGVPILERNVRLLARYGVEEIVINLHHRPEVIVDHFGDGSRFGVKITYSFEERLLGTAGALGKVRDIFRDDFFLVYGDNLTTCDLGALMRLHHERAAALTIALYYREDPRASGIVGLDAEDRIVRFVEKPLPDQIFSHWVNAGYLALAPSVLDLIPVSGASDFGHDIFGKLLWWIDSRVDYERTCREFLELDSSQGQGKG